jgi:hypothetical protein
MAADAGRGRFGSRNVAQSRAPARKRMLKLARQEARSLSQICEMLLKIGVDEYDKDGHKYLQRVLTPPRGEDQG